MAQDLKDLTFDQIADYVRGCGQPPYRAQQIIPWLYKKQINDFSKIGNIPAEFKQRLTQDFYLSEIVLKKKQLSKDQTQKFLFELGKGELIESVLIPAQKRNTACLSTQVGCKYACEFCASSELGFIRNLSQAEILNQILYIAKELKQNRISNIVFMGSGEPLDNYDNVLKSIRVITSPLGFSIGQRKITISTSGVADGIRRLSKEGLQVELSVSLHSADENKRNQIMPINKKYPLSVLIPAIKEFIAKTKRKITFEYLLLGGFNTTIEDANSLIRLLRGVHCKINLIAYNDICAEARFSSPKKLEVLFFKDYLEKNKIEATFRKPRGQDIFAACGQLRSYVSSQKI